MQNDTLLADLAYVSLIGENGILLTSLQLGREKLGSYTCTLPG